MTIPLQRDDFRRLIQLVQRLPGFGNVRDRRQRLTHVLQGEPRADILLASLDLDGPPDLAATEVVTRLLQFGQFTNGREALGVFLHAVLESLGEGEDAAFIRQLFASYPLDIPTGAPPIPKPAVPAAGSPATRYSGKTQLEFCRRLGDDWRHLATWLEIPSADQARFERGDEARQLWTWLDNRQRLAELAPALVGIGREDLAELLQKN
ncbi:MAG: hypothetical protein U1F76_01835 [Candidatus Competibacteraceae bacterium]